MLLCHCSRKSMVCPFVSIHNLPSQLHCSEHTKAPINAWHDRGRLLYVLRASQLDVLSAHPARFHECGPETDLRMSVDIIAVPDVASPCTADGWSDLPHDNSLRRKSPSTHCHRMTTNYTGQLPMLVAVLIAPRARRVQVGLHYYAPFLISNKPVKCDHIEQRNEHYLSGALQSAEDVRTSAKAPDTLLWRVGTPSQSDS